MIRLDRAAVSVGRNSDVDLRFDPIADLDVSGRHALFARTASGAWVIQDLGSTNGTYVNGHRIQGERDLTDSDRIRFGTAGPEVEFRLAASPGSRPASAAPAATARSPAGAADTITIPIARRVRAAAGRAPKRTAALAGTMVLLLVATGLAIQSATRSATLEGERALLQQRLDSLTTTGQQSIASLEGELQELADALRESREEVRQASIQLEQAERRGNSAEVSALREQLAAATTVQGQREAAAGLDLLGIQRLNRHAIAVIYVENEAGGVSTGTAFAVRPDATMITSRHVVAGESGTERPRRIAIQFADSDQVWPARVLRISADVDLAVVKVDNILGSVPTVQSLNARPDTIRAGSVVASIGFPVGRDLSTAATFNRTGLAEPLLSAGIVAAASDERVEFQGYGSAGASGSPVFDATGSVIAVLFGGLVDARYPTLIGVPSTAVSALLEPIP